MNPVLIGCLGFLLGCGSDDVVGPPPASISIQANEQSQTTLQLTHDTYVSHQSRHSNFGADTVLRVERQHRLRALMRIPRGPLLQAIGEDSLVSARLELLVAENGNDWPAQGGVISLHAMSVEWNEAGATWACLIDSDLSNNKADCSPGWSIHGPVVCSSGEPGCFEPWRPTATDSLIVTNGLTGEVSFDVTADIAAILAQGYPDNPYVFGWLLQKPQHNESGDISFTSRDGVRAPRLILTTQESGPSPLAFPPDSFPSQYADSSNIVQTPACSGIRFLRHIILLTFKPGTTLAQREEALALVNGIVVGGRAVTEHHTYYIRVDDDEFGSGVCAATSNLESLAYVESASPSYEIEPFYRTPVDGAGWTNWD